MYLKIFESSRQLRVLLTDAPNLMRVPFGTLYGSAVWVVFFANLKNN
ncbi:MAG: hypothetical protein ACJAXY_000105 [Nonlabens sp.]|jgi:hypothetical protein